MVDARIRAGVDVWGRVGTVCSVNSLTFSSADSPSTPISSPWLGSG